MKLSHLNLYNWGPHEHEYVNMESSIAGIIGANGKGKSFILHGITYAITGVLPYEKTKLLRNYDPSDPERSGKAYKARVLLDFYVDGKLGTIDRQFSDASATRKLTWDGKVYTKKDEVDTKMEELLGADKAALANAVFIKQGELTEIVKGTPAARQEIFRRLMNLNFLSTRYDEVGAMLRNLDLQSVDDVDGKLDVVTEELTEKQNAYADRKEARDRKAESDAYMALFSPLYKLREQIGSKNSEVIANERVTQQAKDNIVQLLRGREIEQVQNECDELGKQHTELKEKLNKHLLADKHIEAVKTYTAAENSDKNIQGAMEAVRIDLQQTIVKFCGLKIESLQNEEVAKSTESMLGTLHDEVNECDNQLNIIDTFISTTSGVLWKLNDKIPTYDIYLNQLEHDDTGKCPVCGSAMDLTCLYNMFIPDYAGDKSKEHISAEISAEKDKALDEQQSAENELKTLEESKSILESKKANVAAKLEFQKAALQTCHTKSVEYQQQLREYMSLLPDLYNNTKTIEEWKAIQNTAAEKCAEYDRLKSMLNSESTMSMLKSAFDTAVEELLKIGNLGDDTPDDIRKKIAELEPRIFELSGILQKVGWQMDTIAQRDASSGELLADLEELTQKRDEINQKIIDTCPDWLPGTTVEELYDNLVEKKGEYDKAAVESEYLKKEIDRLQEIQEELEYKKIHIIKLLRVKKDLQKVKELLSREGLPAVYMQHVFLKLTEKVQELLSMMGANFTVEVDPTQPCTFTFEMLNTAGSYKMPQELLSGGQAVRLALALLLASQQIILPDVGLLVLDEPTSFVDAEGVESIRQLFQNLNTVLDSAGMQLIVVDHHESLQTGFGTTHILN